MYYILFDRRDRPFTNVFEVESVTIAINLLTRMPAIRLMKSCRFWIRLLILIFYLFIIVVLLPLVIMRAVKDGFNKKMSIPIVGGVFVILTLPISFWLIIQHMLYYSKPKLQKHIIRYVYMVTMK